MILCEPTTSKYRDFVTMRHWITTLRRDINRRLKSRARIAPRLEHKPLRTSDYCVGLEGPLGDMPQEGMEG